jgi:6-pyruvoyl-tetrahydropterin synthase-like protein
MKKKELLIILLLLFLSIPSVLPLTHHGFFQTDDGEWMIIRLSAFYQAMHDGQFPVRFLQRLNFGYGYPVAEFLYPGSFYFATLLHVIRFGFVNSIKIVFGLSLVGSVIFTYFWLRKIFSQMASFIGSLFALYLPYHLYDVYKRGSVGEVFALLWVPFIFWQIERKSFFYTSVGIALLIISHNTLAALFLPIIICYMFHPIYRSKNKKQELYYYIRILLSSLGLSAFFWLPVFFELRNTVFSSTTVSQFSNYFATIDQVGYGTLLVLATIVCLFIFKKKLLKNHRLTMLFFIISILAVFLSSSLSASFWNILPVGFIQFPFRFLSVIIVTIPFLVAFIISLSRKKQQWITSAFLVIVLAYCALPYISPVAYFDKGEGYYYTNDATTTVQDEYMPVWVKQKPLKSPDQKVLIIKGSGSINNIQPTNNSLAFIVSLKKTSVVQVNTIYWTGWQATLDGKPVSFSYNNPMGVITFSVPSGNHALRLFFTEDPVRLFSDIISFLTFLWLAFMFIKGIIVARKRS